MKRLAWLTIMMGALWAGAGHAADANLCKSMCSTEKRECRANVLEQARDDGDSPLELPEKNPLARGAQRQVPSESSRAIGNTGTQARRLGNAGKCDEAYQRCTRACAAPPDSILVKPAPGR
jgi:hypothetical protein